jgi:hypothetical protein
MHGDRIFLRNNVIEHRTMALARENSGGEEWWSGEDRGTVEFTHHHGR